MRSLLVPLLFVSCLSRAESAPPAETQYSNDFGARILHQTAEISGRPANRLVSPIANYLAWSMVLNGAEGASRAQLTETLGLEADALALGRINGSNRACLDALVSYPPDEKSKLPKLTIDNGAWVSNQEHGGRPFAFNQGYTSALKTFYGADTTAVNFTDPQSATDINKWFEIKTNKLIPKVVSDDEIRNLTFLLANATYFQGAWASPFNEIPAGGYEGGHYAKETNFTTADGTVSPRTMLTKMAYYKHAKDRVEEIVEIPFLNAAPKRQEFVFLAVLPGQNGDLAPYRYAATWRRVTDKLAAARSREGTLFIPKFGFDDEYEAQRGSPLAMGLGLDHLFQDTADLSAMTTPTSVAAKVGLFKSVNRIELDKNGVKAAAAVVIGGIECASFPQPEFDMHLNRPFAFAILEKVSGALVFLGELNDPK